MTWRLSALIEEGIANLGASAFRSALLLVVSAAAFGGLAYLELRQGMELTVFARDFREGGAYVAIASVPGGSVSGTRCESLNGTPGVVAAGAWRSTGQATFRTAPGVLFQAADVTPGILRVWDPGQPLGTGPGLVVGPAMAGELGLRTGLIAGFEGDEPVVVSGVGDFSKRNPQAARWALSPVSPAGSFQECWVEFEPGAFEAGREALAARFAADVMGVPTIILARTDAEAANLITSDHDANDKPFLTGERTQEGFYRVKNGLEQAISRGVAYAPYADLVWCETGTPDLGFAREFAQAVLAKHPGKLLSYNCSPSFNWKKNLDDATIAKFQDELSALGYKYQFITLAGIHSNWYNTFKFAHAYARGEGMKHYVEMIQEPEFAAREQGYTFVSHQQEVGAGYFDDVTTVIQGGSSSVKALTGSTEEEQFH